MLSQHEAREYELFTMTLFMSIIYSWFPKYWVWVCKRRYKRYLGSLEYTRLRMEQEKKRQEMLNKIFIKK